ncbi:hypothetical protein J1N35_007685, partial [Gossypium stocksii]
MDCPFSDMVKDDGLWNLELFHLLVSKEVISRIVGVLPLHPSSGLDNVIWQGTTTGSFSLKSAYDKLEDRNALDSSFGLPLNNAYSRTRK